MSKIPIREYLDGYGDGIHGTPVYADEGEYYFVNGNNIKDGKIIVDTNTLKISKQEYEKIKRPLNENSLLISINGTLGNIGVYKGEKIALGKSACYLNVKDNCNKYFVKYLLSTKEFQKYIMLVAHGSTIKNLAPSQIADYVPELPDDINVDKIASLLKSIDDKIESNKQIINTLEQMAKTLYDYWFVQFDFPDANGRPYKTSGGKMEWNETLSREIPAGWEVKKLGDICETHLGGTPDTNNGDYWGGDIPWLNSGEVAISPILSSEKKITDLGRDSSATSTADPGDVLMSITRYIRPSILGISACYNQSVVAVLQNERYKTSFIYPFLLSQVERYMGLRIGAQQPHINKKIVDSTLVINPSKSILDKYYVKVDKVYRQIINIAKENKKLIELRDFLLPMLMNGQVTFRQ